MCNNAPMKGYITTKEAAERLGVSKRRVLALIEAGALPADLFGKFYVIKAADLKLVENRKPGRPRK
jgi:excisionase family DNA binding protein